VRRTTETAYTEEDTEKSENESDTEKSESDTGQSEGEIFGLQKIHTDLRIVIILLLPMQAKMMDLFLARDVIRISLWL